jgi:hypothetical protein
MLKVYSLYDNKAEIYNQPLCTKTEVELKESLKYTIEEDEENAINPVDYDVFELGEYDPTCGKYDLLEAPKHLFNLKNLIKKEEE